MLSLVLALAVVGQCGPQSPCWLDTVVNGRTVKVYGWMEGGFVRWWPAQNRHLDAPAPKAQPKPEPAPEPEPDPSPEPTAMAGVTKESNGDLNAGVDLGHTPVAETLDTNDRDFGAAFFRPVEQRRPEPPPWEPSAPAPSSGDAMQPYILPGAIVAGAVLLGLFGLLRRSQP